MYVCTMYIHMYQWTKSEERNKFFIPVIWKMKRPKEVNTDCTLYREYRCTLYSEYR